VEEGSIAMIVSGSCMFFGVLGVRYLEERDRKRFGDGVVYGYGRDSETSSVSGEGQMGEKGEKGGVVPGITAA
jgi:hypothetical protein